MFSRHDEPAITPTTTKSPLELSYSAAAALMTLKNISTPAPALVQHPPEASKFGHGPNLISRNPAAGSNNTTTKSKGQHTSRS